MILACGGSPFPEVPVHIVHAVPAAALFLASAALHGLGVCIALVLTVAVAIGVASFVLAAARRLPFVDAAEVLAGLLAELYRLFLVHHVTRDGIRFVRVFVGVHADRLPADGDGVGVLAAYVVRCHVVFGLFPFAAVADGILGEVENASGLVVFNGLACLDRIHSVANRKECLALDFVAFYLQLDGVVVAAGRRRDFGGRGCLVRGTDAVLHALLFK